MTYAEKLKDPRWQKKRLEILNRADWACEVCCANDKTLHVHHVYYEYGKDPWDYTSDTLMSLCEDCHKERGEKEAALKLAFARLLRIQRDDALDELLRSIESMVRCEFRHTTMVSTRMREFSTAAISVVETLTGLSIPEISERCEFKPWSDEMDMHQKMMSTLFPNQQGNA